MTRDQSGEQGTPRIVTDGWADRIRRARAVRDGVAKTRVGKPIAFPTHSRIPSSPFSRAPLPTVARQTICSAHLSHFSSVR
jgi:hypothetical protein